MSGNQNSLTTAELYCKIDKSPKKIPTKIGSLYYFTIVLYCFIYFILSTTIYFFSVRTGNEGLGLSLFGGSDDGSFYYEQALNVSEGRPAILTSIHAQVLGWVFKIFNTEQVYVLRAFNFFGSILSLLIGLKVLSLLHLGKQKFNAGIIFTLLLVYYPSFVLNTNLSIIRDNWIVFYYLLSILLILNVLRSSEYYMKIINVILLFFSLWMLMGYRNYALLGFVASTLIYFIVNFQKKNGKQFLNLVIYMIVGFSVVYTFFRTYQFPIVQKSLLDILVNRTSELDLYGGGSQMFISLDQSNVLLFYMNYFYSVLSNVLGPFPFQFTGISTVVIFLTECLLFYFIIFTLFKCKSQLDKYDYFIIIHSIVWFMLIGIFNDNIGTAARLRMVGWIPLFIVFAKVYGEQLILRREMKINRASA